MTWRNADSGGEADRDHSRDDSGDIGFSFKPLLVLVVLVALITVTVLGTAVVQGQEASTTTTTAENETQPTYAIQVDDHLRVVDYEYSGSSFTVTLEADRPTLVAVSDLGGAVAPGGGARNIEQSRQTVPRGTSEITVAASTYRGVATISIASPDGAVALTSEHSEPLIGGPFTGQDTQIVGLTAMSTAFVMVVVVFARRRETAADEPQRRF